MLNNWTYIKELDEEYFLVQSETGCYQIKKQNDMIIYKKTKTKKDSGWKVDKFQKEMVIQRTTIYFLGIPIYTEVRDVT